MADMQRKRREGLKTLENKIDNLSSIVDKAIQRWDKSAEQVVQSQIAIAKIETEQNTMCNDINALETKVNGWSSLNSLGVVIAGIVAAIGAWLSGK